LFDRRIAWVLLAAGCGQSAPEPPRTVNVTLSHVGDAGAEQAQFRLVNGSEETIEYLANFSTVPILAYNADRAPQEDGCVKVDLPQFSAYPLMHGETLQFEYMDPRKVQVFGVYVRVQGSKCWQMALARRTP
jgi:hypothetical protein